jgi:predicted PhzF superfamily epimerase YddE/YHI9
MELPIYQVDAFADTVFKGNPAAIMPLEEWLDDATLQAIAMENNLSETAYLVTRGNAYELRWFTPAVEVELCGHATLATAPGDNCDFVSRFFGPQVGIDEDPVTGSAHCSLVPYWAGGLTPIQKF